MSCHFVKFHCTLLPLCSCKTEARQVYFYGSFDAQGGPKCSTEAQKQACKASSKQYRALTDKSWKTIRKIQLKRYTIVLEPHSKLQLHNKKQGTPMKALHDSHLKYHQATSLRRPQSFFLRKTSVIRLLLHRRSDVHEQWEDVSSAAASNQVMFSFWSRVLCHLMIITGGLCCSCGHMICCYWLTQRSG